MMIDEDMRCSYSKKGNPRDNTCIESFNVVIKKKDSKDSKSKTIAKHAI